MFEILGIICIIFIIVKKTKLFAREVSHDVEAAGVALQNEDVAYRGFDGKMRLIGSNEQVMFHVDEVSKDSGYLIIKPGKNYMKFINLDAIRRENAWRIAHDDYLKNGLKEGAPTVIEYESQRSELDHGGLSYYKDGEGLCKVKPRECRGRRYRDIATGKMLVERSWPKDGVDCKLDVYFYMDIETGEWLRPSDREVSSLCHRFNLEWIDKVLEMANKNVKDAAAKGWKVDYANRYAYNVWGRSL